VLTVLIPVIVQIPASYVMNFEKNADGKEISDSEQAAVERPYTLVGFIVSSLCFFGYCLWQVLQSDAEKRLEVVIDAIKQKKIGLRAALEFIKYNAPSSKELPTLATGILPQEDPSKTQLKKILRPFFKRFDLDHSGFLEPSEFAYLLKDMGELYQPDHLKDVFTKFDPDNDEKVNFDEFVDATYDLVFKEDALKPIDAHLAKIVPTYGIEDEEEEEMPEELSDLDPASQKRQIICMAIRKLALGSLIIIVFSDPFVDVLSALSTTVGIPPFFVGFIIAPFGSNGSEVLVAYQNALKKSSKTATNGVATLIGAACMNNTLGLSALFGLCYFRGIAWKFSAEVISLVGAQMFIGYLAWRHSTHTRKTAMLIAAVYPLTIALTWFMENVLGISG